MRMRMFRELPPDPDIDRETRHIQSVPGGGGPEILVGLNDEPDLAKPTERMAKGYITPGLDEPIEPISKYSITPDRRKPRERVSKGFITPEFDQPIVRASKPPITPEFDQPIVRASKPPITPDRRKPSERESKGRAVPVQESPAVRALSESLPPTLPPGSELSTGYLLDIDQFGRSVLRLQRLVSSRVAFEQALDGALRKGLEVSVQRDQDPASVPARLSIAQDGRPFTLHDAVKGAHVTLALAGGQTVEGFLKLCGVSDTSARVGGKVTSVGLRFAFRPLSAGLEVGMVVLEVGSFLLPFGDRGDPHVMDMLIRGWVNDALDS